MRRLMVRDHSNNWDEALRVAGTISTFSCDIARAVSRNHNGRPKAAVVEGTPCPSRREPAPPNGS